MKIFGREPAVWLGFIASVLGLIVAFGVGGLTEDQASVIVTAIAAVGMAVAAVFTRPFVPALVTAAVVAVGGMLLAFGIEVSAEVVASVNFAVLNVLALVGVRPQVAPTPPDALT